MIISSFGNAMRRLRERTHCPNSKLADKFFFFPWPSPLPIEILLVERKRRSSGGKSRNDPQSRVKRSAKKGKGSGETLPMTFRLIDDARAASRFTFRIISSRRREGERREASFLNEIRSLRFDSSARSCLCEYSCAYFQR